MLNGWSIPPLLLASINAYVAVHYSVIYLRTRHSREPLTFAHLALFVALYDICCAFVYNADTPAAARPWQLGQFAAITLGAVALILFVAGYTGRPAGRLTNIRSSSSAPRSTSPTATTSGGTAPATRAA